MDINYSPKALKFLKKQSPIASKRIIKAINKLPKGDVKRLEGSQDFRLRVGKFRILFDRAGNVIDIIDIDSRGQIYKRR